MVLVAQGLAILPGCAHASSRFNLGEASPLRANAHLDFTIVVPEIIQLEDRGESDGSKSHNGTPTFVNSTTGMVIIVGDKRSSLVVHGNSGTLAFQHAPISAVHQTGQQDAIVAIVVSMP